MTTSRALFIKLIRQYTELAYRMTLKDLKPHMEWNYYLPRIG